MWKDPAASDENVAWERSVQTARAPYITTGILLNFQTQVGDDRLKEFEHAEVRASACAEEALRRGERLPAQQEHQAVVGMRYRREAASRRGQPRRFLAAPPEFNRRGTRARDSSRRKSPRCRSALRSRSLFGRRRPWSGRRRRRRAADTAMPPAVSLPRRDPTPPAPRLQHRVALWPIDRTARLWRRYLLWTMSFWRSFLARRRR